MSVENTSTQSRRWTAPFFTIWTGQAFSLLGSSLVQFALVWWLTTTTGSATILATATMVAIIPGVVLGPFAGALVDRWNRRLTMIVADGIIALVTVGLAVLFATDAVRVWHIYLLLFIRALASGFHWPAMGASTSLMVPEKHLARVSGLNQMLQGGMSIVAPPIAALLLSLIPIQSILAIDVGTALLAIIPLFFISVPQPQRTGLAAGVGRASLWRDMGEGLRYIWNWPGALILLLMATVINFTVNPGFTLMPLLITGHFGGGAPQLAGMESALGIGIVVGGLVLSAWGGFRRRILTTLVGLVGMGLGTVVVGLAPGTAFWLALGAMGFAGFMNALANAPVTAILQARVAPEMQGRVFTVVGSITAGMSPLGMALAGPVADWVGVRTWFVFGGTVCALMGVVGFFIPLVVHLEDRPTVAEEQASTGAEEQRSKGAKEQGAYDLLPS